MVCEFRCHGSTQLTVALNLVPREPSTDIFGDVSSMSNARNEGRQSGRPPSRSRNPKAPISRSGCFRCRADPFFTTPRSARQESMGRRKSCSRLLPILRDIFKMNCHMRVNQTNDCSIRVMGCVSEDRYKRNDDSEPGANVRAARTSRPFKTYVNSLTSTMSRSNIT